MAVITERQRGSAFSSDIQFHSIFSIEHKISKQNDTYDDFGSYVVGHACALGLLVSAARRVGAAC